MTAEEATFVKARLKGKNKSQAAMEAKPNISPTSAGKIGNRLSNNVNVQIALQNALQKHNITIDRTAQVVSDAMGAEKTVIIGKGDDAFADVVPDHTSRLSAARLATELLGLKDRPNLPDKPPNANPEDLKELASAIRNGNEVEITKAVWKAKDGS